MPHLILDCSENVLKLQPPELVIKAVHDEAESTGLFRKGDIKVRMQPFTLFTVGGTSNDFIHVRAHIMGGRTVEQKKDLSKRVVTLLKELFPSVPVISMEVIDIDKSTYSNRFTV
jgi:5-carboxymethyl-2-hydroxymuconate isomerase